VAQASPLTHVTKGAPPFLIVQGDADPQVPPEQSELLHAALRKAGVESTLEVIRGGGHGGPAFNTPELAEKIEGFFRKHLGKQ
jgi:dipeptidyl aminopeptidase/acylaminoacyl peptidase